MSIKLSEESIEEAQNWIAETEEWIKKKQNEVVNIAFSAELSNDKKRVKIELITNDVLMNRGGLALLKNLVRNSQ